MFGDNQHLIIGIFMLGEAVLDLVTYLLLKHGMKKKNAPDGEEPAVLTEPAALSEPAVLPEPETTEESEAREETEPFPEKDPED